VDYFSGVDELSFLGWHRCCQEQDDGCKQQSETGIRRDRGIGAVSHGHIVTNEAGGALSLA
jgi:hypothetical protein